jgi:hypothetical protein
MDVRMIVVVCALCFENSDAIIGVTGATWPCLDREFQNDDEQTVRMDQGS